MVDSWNYVQKVDTSISVLTTLNSHVDLSMILTYIL